MSDVHMPLFALLMGIALFFGYGFHKFFFEHLTLFWHHGFTRVIREYLHPPHMLCPLDHLTEKQWKHHAHAWIKWEKDFANLPGELWQAYRVDKKSWKEAGSDVPFTIPEWLEQEGLPPIPRELYDPVSQNLVKYMLPAQREAYLESLNKGRLHLVS